MTEKEQTRLSTESQAFAESLSSDIPVGQRDDWLTMIRFGFVSLQDDHVLLRLIVDRAVREAFGASSDLAPETRDSVGEFACQLAESLRVDLKVR